MKKLTVFISAFFDTLWTIGVGTLVGPLLAISYLIGNTTLLKFV